MSDTDLQQNLESQLDILEWGLPDALKNCQSIDAMQRLQTECLRSVKHVQSSIPSTHLQWQKDILARCQALYGDISDQCMEKLILQP